MSKKEQRGKSLGKPFVLIGDGTETHLMTNGKVYEDGILEFDLHHEGAEYPEFTFLVDTLEVCASSGTDIIEEMHEKIKRVLYPNL